MFSFSGLQDQCIKYTTKTCLHFRRLFLIMLVIDISTRIMSKYKIDASCPMIMKGCLTRCPLIHVSVSRSATKIQNRH